VEGPGGAAGPPPGPSGVRRLPTDGPHFRDQRTHFVQVLDYPCTNEQHGALPCARCLHLVRARRRVFHTPWQGWSTAQPAHPATVCAPAQLGPALPRAGAGGEAASGRVRTEDHDIPPTGHDRLSESGRMPRLFRRAAGRIRAHTRLRRTVLQQKLSTTTRRPTRGSAPRGPLAGRARRPTVSMSVAPIHPNLSHRTEVATL
jgi:hypothetical protein